MIMNSQEAENLYRQLGRLIEVMPDLASQEPLSQEKTLWLARAFALVEATGQTMDSLKLKRTLRD